MKSVTYIEIDVPSFTPAAPEETQTFRFAMPAAYLPPEIDCIPSVQSISFTPARVSLGKDLGQRASLKISFSDHKHIFAGESYDAGSFWGKWRGRYGVTLRGRALRIIRGRLGQALADMDTRHYAIESTEGPTPDGVYAIEAKDILKFADEDRAQAPRISNGRLAGSINTATTAATLSPAGIGDAEYPASGYLCLGGKEVVGFTRSGNSLTLTRGQFGSLAQAHDSGDRAQLVLRYAGNDPADIIHDLLTSYAGVPPAYIALAEWRAETDSYLGALYARTITEPTSVRQLINEMIEQAALVVWWDDRAQRVRLSVLRDIPTGNAAFTHDNMLAGSLKVSEQPLKRISQIWTFYGTRDATDRGAEDDNYRAALADVDLDKEAEYGSAEIRKIRAGWIETATAAERLNSIQLSRFRDPPRAFSFDLPISEQIAIAAGYTIAWWANQNAAGEPVPTQIQITQLALHADRIHVEAEEMLASGEVAALVNVVFLTQTGGVLAWQVDPSWNAADHAIHTIGGGAGGGASGVDGGKGGGGGAYSRASNVPLTPASPVSYRVGAGGIGGADGQPPNTATGSHGGDSWFGDAGFAGSMVGARGGQGGSGRSGGGQGGQAAAGIGALRFSGGDGGNGAPKGDTRAGGGGGGGAAGPNGQGADGGTNGSGGQDGGAGGGAADGGSAGSGASSGNGGQGGNNRFHFGGGHSGASGQEGGGGGGGNRSQDGGPGGPGEQLWTQTVNPIVSAGPGGGGGGAGDGARAGKGGRYGGGGGGNGGDGSAANDGEQGIIILIWREAA